MEAEYLAAYTRLYREHWWWRVRETIVLSKIRGLLKSPTSETRILDVGCGAGLFFGALEEFGRVQGIESDPVAVEMSGEARDRIHLGKLDETFTPEAPFDLILLLDVLEHVQQPGRVLRRAASILAPAGRVLVTVPAFDWLWTSHDELNHHVKRYSAAEVHKLLEEAGLTVLDARYLFQSLILPKLVLRAREAIGGSHVHVPRVPPPTMNSALERWYRSEHAIAGWLPFGSSVIAVAKLS
jgi:2-polyprenyl-3-methyl-5-hydroxy-6-metoxy-1,4-benzoquinol methylase